jgi:hypothetical protein
LFDVFLPRSRAEVHQIVELVAPSAFHGLLFALKPEPEIHWRAPELLRQNRVSRTSLYAVKRSPRIKHPNALRHVSLTSKPTNTLIDLQVPAWLGAILRLSASNRSVAEVLGDAVSVVSADSLRKHLYLLYLLAVINLRPHPKNESGRP